MAKKIMSSSTQTDEMRRNQEAAGIPDSRPFVSADPQESGESTMLKCHINGVAIADLNLDPQVLSALDYWLTDEGIAEKNARPNVREPSGVSLGQDSFAKALHQRRDDVEDRDYALYEARDPLKEVADRFVGPGMSPKFLSGSKVKDSAGTGDYEIVKDPATGDPVRVRGMVLGQMPAERAKARNKHYRDRGNTLLKEIDKRFKDEVPNAASDQS